MNIQLKTRQQKGFTIIELVVVILLLGILAATALPRFLDVTDEAHDAVVDGLQGGITTGAALFRATWVAQGQSLTEVVEGFGLSNLFANASGYPVGLKVSADMDADSCLEIYNGILQSGRPLAASVNVAYDDIADSGEISTAVDNAAAGVQIAAVTIPVADADYTDATECRFYYIGQFPDAAPSAPAAAFDVPVLTLNLTTGEVTRGILAYQLP